MRRVPFVTMLIVLMLAFSPVVFAEVESMIGKQVQGQFPVKVEGKKLDVQAIVIDGTSYLPVRAIAEALGKEVKFDADLGIELYDKEVSPLEMTEEEAKSIQNVKAQIERFNAIISDNESRIAEFEIEKAKAVEAYEKAQTEHDRINYKAGIEYWEMQINSLAEQNETLRQAIQESEVYIEKIRAKYQTVE